MSREFDEQKREVGEAVSRLGVKCGLTLEARWVLRSVFGVIVFVLERASIIPYEEIRLRLCEVYIDTDGTQRMSEEGLLTTEQLTNAVTELTRKNLIRVVPNGWAELKIDGRVRSFGGSWNIKGIRRAISVSDLTGAYDDEQAATVPPKEEVHLEDGIALTNESISVLNSTVYLNSVPLSQDGMVMVPRSELRKILEDLERLKCLVELRSERPSSEARE